MDGPRTLVLLAGLVTVAAAAAVRQRRTRAFAGWRGVGLVLAIGVAAVVLHNEVYAIFEVEEAIFLLVAVAAAFACPIMVVLRLDEAWRDRGSRSG